MPCDSVGATARVNAGEVLASKLGRCAPASECVHTGQKFDWHERVLKEGASLATMQALSRHADQSWNACSDNVTLARNQAARDAMAMVSMWVKNTKPVSGERNSLLVQLLKQRLGFLWCERPHLATTPYCRLSHGYHAPSPAAARRRWTDSCVCDVGRALGSAVCCGGRRTRTCIHVQEKMLPSQVDKTRVAWAGPGPCR